MSDRITGPDGTPFAGRDLRLIDVTLRDGEQTVGVVFAQREKVRIATLLAEIGVPALEAGYPILGTMEQDCIRAVVDQNLGVDVKAFCRARPEDVRAAAECGVNAVVLSISTSDEHVQKKFRQSQQWVLDQVVAAAEEAKKLGLRFTVSAEDASRTSLGFLKQYYRQAESLGAETIRYCDTLGVCEPLECFRRIQEVISFTNLPLEMHMHNDFGMATANALAGVRAGADIVAVSVGGLGERTGNSPLEEVVMALKVVYGVDLGVDTTRFREMAEYVSEASSRAIPIWKAIVGTNIFAHESGIHADGVLKNPKTYEAFSPEDVGLERQLIVGKHSGSASIKHKFEEFGISLSDQEAADILEIVRSMTVELKRPPFDKEIMYVYKDYRKGKVQEARQAG